MSWLSLATVLVALAINGEVADGSALPAITPNDGENVLQFPNSNLTTPLAETTEADDEDKMKGNGTRGGREGGGLKPRCGWRWRVENDQKQWKDQYEKKWSETENKRKQAEEKWRKELEALRKSMEEWKMKENEERTKREEEWKEERRKQQGWENRIEEIINRNFEEWKEKAEREEIKKKKQEELMKKVEEDRKRREDDKWRREIEKRVEKRLLEEWERREAEKETIRRWEEVEWKRKLEEKLEIMIAKGSFEGGHRRGGIDEEGEYEGGVGLKKNFKDVKLNVKIYLNKNTIKEWENDGNEMVEEFKISENKRFHTK